MSRAEEGRERRRAAEQNRTQSEVSGAEQSRGIERENERKIQTP